MKCPIDQIDLQMSERQGIEIDYCSQCRGVWLDRGELDKIIDRSATDSPVGGASAPHVEPQRDNSDHRQYGRNDNHQDYKKRKKESFLGDLFDF